MTKTQLIRIVLAASMTASSACGVKGAPQPPAFPQVSDPAPLRSAAPDDVTTQSEQATPASKKKEQQQ